MEGFPMRRIAVKHRYLAPIVFTIVLALSSLVPAYAAENGQKNGQNNNDSRNAKKNSVMVRVQNVSQVEQLLRKYGLKLNKTVGRGTAATFLVEGLSEGQVKQLLKDEPGFVFAETN